MNMQSPPCPMVNSSGCMERDLSDVLVWSRMQTEAGQPLEAIVERKEIERKLGNGLFFWGVGNAPARACSILARTNKRVDVVFSKMKTKPKIADVAPSQIFVWNKYIDIHGAIKNIPGSVFVSSRGRASGEAKTHHYALMCYSENPLVLSDYGHFSPDSYRNYGGNGAPIGNSQVTALLKLSAESKTLSDYRINLRATLTGSYWVKLLDPIEISGPDRQDFQEKIATLTLANWEEFVHNVRRRQGRSPCIPNKQPLLL